MARRFATRIQGDSRESIRRKTPMFITCKRFPRIASNLRFAIFSPPESRFAKRGVQFGSPEPIRENQAIRANLRIDSRESGHLSSGVSLALFQKRSKGWRFLQFLPPGRPSAKAKASPEMSPRFFSVATPAEPRSENYK